MAFPINFHVFPEMASFQYYALPCKLYVDIFSEVIFVLWTLLVLFRSTEIIKHSDYALHIIHRMLLLFL